MNPTLHIDVLIMSVLVDFVCLLYSKVIFFPGSGLCYKHTYTYKHMTTYTCCTSQVYNIT